MDVMSGRPDVHIKKLVEFLFLLLLLLFISQEVVSGELFTYSSHQIVSLQ